MGNTVILFHRHHQPLSGPCPLLSLHCRDLLVLGGLFDGGLLADDLLQPLQPDVLGAQVPHARLAAVEQGQGIDVLQLRVANALVHHEIEQLVCGVVQHLIVLPERGDMRNEVRESKKKKTSGERSGVKERMDNRGGSRGGKEKKRELITLYSFVLHYSCVE